MTEHRNPERQKSPLGFLQMTLYSNIWQRPVEVFQPLNLSICLYMEI